MFFLCVCLFVLCVLCLEIILYILIICCVVNLAYYLYIHNYSTFTSLSFLCRTLVHYLLLTMTCVGVTQGPIAGMIEQVFQSSHSVVVKGCCQIYVSRVFPRIRLWDSAQYRCGMVQCCCVRVY